MRIMRLTVAALALAALSTAAMAQNEPAQNAPASPPAAGQATPPAAKPDPVVAKVGGADVHLSDIDAAVQSLPEEYRNMPAPMLYPMLLDQAVDRKALVMLAQKQGLDKDPQVQRQMARAEEQALQSALLSRVVGPQVSDQAVRARYEQDIAGKPGEEEVHARHVLVASEEEAKKIIAELKAGGDFVALAKAHSTDPGAAEGGDLGFFKKGDMLPEFSAAAFALQPGQITDTPVHTQYGWHIIKVEERRRAPPPSFEQARNDLRQQMIREDVQKVVQEARAGVTVEKFNPDGSVPKATDTAQPPPATGPADTAPQPHQP